MTEKKFANNINNKILLFENKNIYYFLSFLLVRFPVILYLNVLLKCFVKIQVWLKTVKYMRLPGWRPNDVLYRWHRDMKFNNTRKNKCLCFCGRNVNGCLSFRYRGYSNEMDQVTTCTKGSKDPKALHRCLIRTLLIPC